MGFRVIKTAIAAALAIYLSDFLSIPSPMSAGLLAIMAVDVTRKRTIHTALVRFGSSVMALAISTIIFYILGFHYWVVAVYILITFPILARIKLKDGIVTASVIVFHVFTASELTVGILWNELLLLIIGLGSGTIINMLYMPKSERKLNILRDNTEQLFSTIFGFIAKHLRNHETLWSGNELLEAQKTIDEAILLVARYEGNQLFGFDTYWPIYFQMRRQQLESIHRMVETVARVYDQLPHGDMVAELFDELSRDVKMKYYKGNVSRQLEEVENQFKIMDLPTSRAEFEIRSAILQLAVELKHYMSISIREKKRYPE